MSVKIVYKDVAVGADEDAVMSAVGASDLSTIALIPFGNDNRNKYATLERNFWVLDGTRKLVTSADQFSFWSTELSGDDGRFTTPPEITATMDEQYSSLGIMLDFGNLGYCSEVEIIWYQGSTVLEQKTFYPNAATFYCEQSVTSYNKVTLRLIKTNIPNRRARLNAIYFGITRTFQRDELRSVKIEQEINLISQETPENTLDWTLNSAEVIDYLFQAKQPVEAYNGESLIGVFYISDSDRKSARVYSVTCVDAIGVLDDEPFPDAVYTDKNALALANEICGDFDVEMDADLQSKTVTGIIARKTRREALQQLCFAIGAVADTSGSRSVRIFKPATDNAKEIPANRVRVGGVVRKEGVVTAIQLTAHSYSTSGEGESVEINGTRYYDTKTVTTINNPNVTASDKPNVVSIADATLISSANVAEIAQRVYDYYMRRNTHSVSFRLEDEKVGDYISTPTSWGDMVTGNYTKASIVLSGIAVTTAEVVGT